MSVIDLTSGTAYTDLSAAIDGSAVGDTIAISPGRYVEPFPSITHSLSIVSVGGLSYLSDPTSVPPNGRAVLNVPGNANVNLSINGLALSGATDANNNGAGILFETGNGTLTVRNSWIFGNQDGILTGGVDAANPEGMFIRILNSEIDHNGVAPSNPRYGYDHNIYVGFASGLTVTGSYIHDALGGHEVKSDAAANTITDNRIQDGPTATTSYSVDLPYGGADVVGGNVIEKGASAPNKYFVQFGQEGSTSYAASTLSIAGNTFIDDRGGSVALLNQTSDPAAGNAPDAASIAGNIFYGIGPGSLSYDQNGAPYDTASNNIFLPLPGPPLDSSAPFAVTEPASGTLLGLAMLAAATLRRLRRARATKQCVASATRSRSRAEDGPRLFC